MSTSMYRLVSCCVMTVAVLALGGCGRSAAAQEKMPSIKAAANFVDMSGVAVSSRPDAPFKAPVFHQPNAKPVLSSRLVNPVIQADK